MEKINITIPDNLTPIEELTIIGKNLGKKLLPSNQKQIGNGYEIKHLQTQIFIKREAVERPIITLECPVCKNIVGRNLAKVLWTNYGGNIKRHYYCSDYCREVILQIAGNGRASIKRNQLSSIY